MAITRHFCEAVITRYGWEPYIKGGWMRFSKRPAGGWILTFQGHEEHQYKCSTKIADELLALAKQ